MGIEIDGVNNKIDLDDDKDTSISSASDDTLVVEVGGNSLATLTANKFTINDNLTVTTADTTDTLIVQSTDAGASAGPHLILDRASASPADDDLIGRISYRMRNDADEQIDLVKTSCFISDASDGTEDTQFEIDQRIAGTFRNMLTMASGGIIFNEDSQNIDFRVESDNFTHALFVDGGTGNVFINQSSNYSSGALQVTESTGDTQPAWFQHDASSGNPYGIVVQFRNQSPDNNVVYLQSWQDSSAIRARCWADGDFQNHDGTFSTLSDERIKQDIVDANSQWNDIKALQFKNFKKKDDVAQYGDEAPVHLGLIAQELESISPSLVKEYAASELDKDLHPDFNDWENSTIKGVKYSILYMKAVKALQEAMSRIEELETKVEALENA